MRAISRLNLLLAACSTGTISALEGMDWFLGRSRRRNESLLHRLTESSLRGMKCDARGARKTVIATPLRSGGSILSAKRQRSLVGPPRAERGVAGHSC